MSLIKAKFNKGKARRTKLSNRNKIEYLHNMVKKMKMEKKVLAKRLQDELKSEKKKVDNLKKQIECPVCLEVPRKGPVFACLNGHLVCQKCKQESCATCKEKVGHGKSLVALTVIENVLHDCKFIECEEEMPLKEIEEHEKVCDHRIVACPYFGQCDQRVPLSKLMDHLESPLCCYESGPTIVLNGSSAVEKFNLSALEKLQNPRISWSLITYCYKGYYFVLKVEKSGDYWRFVIVMFESPEVCSKFNLKMKVYESNSSPDTRLSTKVRCHPCSIDQTEAEMEGFGLYVPHRFMEEMMLKEDVFKFTVCFSFF